MAQELVEKKLSCDIEAAFLDISFQELVKFLGDAQLPGCSCEDKKELGWGAVVSKDEETFGYRQEISSFVVEFLHGFSSSIKEIRRQNPKSRIIVRVGVYHETYSFTFCLDLKLINQLQYLGVELEISTYPSAET